MGGSKGGDQVIGYKYYLGIDFAWCHAPIDRCTAIWLDNREIYRGCFEPDQTIKIDKPELFGEFEGGISATIDMEDGSEDQTANTYTVSQTGSDTPAYRGVTRTVFRGNKEDGSSRSAYVGNNPYLKRVSAEFQRIYKRIQDGAVVDNWQNSIAGVPLIDADTTGLTFSSGTVADQSVFINMDLSSASNGFAGEDGTIIGNGLGITSIKAAVIESLKEIRDTLLWETEPSEDFLSQESNDSGLDIGVGYIRFTTGAQNNNDNNPNDVDPYKAIIPTLSNPLPFGGRWNLPQRGWMMKENATRSDIDELISFVSDFVVVPDTEGIVPGENRELVQMLYDNANEAFSSLSTSRLRGLITYSGFVTDEANSTIESIRNSLQSMMLTNASDYDHPLLSVYGPSLAQYNSPDTTLSYSSTIGNGDGKGAAVAAMSNIFLGEGTRWNISQGGWYKIFDSVPVVSANGIIRQATGSGAPYDVGDPILVNNPAGDPNETPFGIPGPNAQTWYWGPGMTFGIYAGNFDVVEHWQRDDTSEPTKITVNRGGAEYPWKPYHNAGPEDLFTRDRSDAGAVDEEGSEGIYLIDICGGYVEMNPAHIIRECLTDQQWGLGLPEADIDETSFAASAQTLYDERFGLSMAWTRETPIEDFVNVVLNHIDAVLFVDRSDGLWHLKLIRDDYDIESLDEYTDADVVSWDSVNIKSPAELANSVTIKYNSRELRGEASLTVKNLAQIQKLGKVISTTVNYPGIWQDTLATRVAQRDLITLSTSLIAGEITLTRKAYDLSPGDVFKLTSSRYNLSGEIMRVVEVNVGDGRQNAVRVKFTQDKYNFDFSEETDLINPGDSEFIDPVASEEPDVVEDRIVTEEPYYLFVERNGETLAGEIETQEIDIGYVFGAANPPTTGSISARIYFDDGGGYKLGPQIPYGPYGTLGAELVEEADDKTVTLSTFKFFEDVSVNDLIQIDDEIMRVESIDSATQLTVGRGALDTVPAWHGVGVPVFFLDNSATVSQVEQVASDSIDVKLLDNTNRLQLDISEAPVDTVVLDSRITSPYPVGQLQLDGSYRGVWDISTGNTISVTWVDRDRTLMNTSQPPAHEDASVGPETDVNYTISAVAYDYRGEEYSGIGDLFSVDKNQTTSHTVTPSDNTPESEGTEVWSAVGIRVKTTREDSTSVEYDNWQTPEVMAYTPAEPTDLYTFEFVYWGDVGSLSTVFTDPDTQTNVASDGDDVGLMENIV